MDVLETSLLAIVRTLGLDADRLIVGEVRLRFVGPLRLIIDGEISE